MGDTEKEQIAAAIRHYISSNNISREQFAYKAKLSKSTIDKLLIGIFTNKAIDKIESNIGVRFRSHNIIKKQSPDYLGAYSYDDHSRYEGYFELIRPSFQDINVIHCYATEIIWDEKQACLIIRHLGIDESAYKQIGTISMPASTRYFCITFTEKGWNSLSILSKLDFSRTMYGAMYCLGDLGMQGLSPVIVPLVLKGVSSPPSTRAISAKDKAYEQYESAIKSVIPGEYIKSLL